MLAVRIGLSVLFVVLIVTGMTIQVLAEARGSQAGARPWLRHPRTWYVAAVLVFATVIAVTILGGEDS